MRIKKRIKKLKSELSYLKLSFKELEDDFNTLKKYKRRRKEFYNKLMQTTIVISLFIIALTSLYKLFN